VFGEFVPAGALLTLLVLPPFTLLCLIAWIGALLPISVFASVAELAARALYALLELGDALPGTPLPLPPRPELLLGGATALLFLGLRRSWARRPALVAWGALLVPWSAAPLGLELHLLDVGHGTGLVLRAPGMEALVFDAGSRDRRSVEVEALQPLLCEWEAARPLVVLSHADEDHASGLQRLSQRYPLCGLLGGAPAQRAVRLPHSGLRLDPRAGSLLFATPSPELRLRLHRGAAGDGNEGSRALEVLWRGERLLLLGDAEREGLEGIDLRPGPLRLLLAPHHGSDAARLGPVLDGSPPAEVWVSASRRPPIGPELDRRGIPWRWTGRDGPLALRLR